MMRISKKLQVTRKTEKRRDNVFQWSRVACTTTAPIAPIGLASGKRGLAGLDGGTESVSREKGWEVGGVTSGPQTEREEEQDEEEEGWNIDSA